MLDHSLTAPRVLRKTPPSVHQEKPAISVVGLGYVGAVSTACLAHLGHKVIGVDVNQDKVEQISAGLSPIHEKDLGRHLNEGVKAGLISATDDLAYAVRESEVTFVSVGTPTAEDGECDYTYLDAAARAIGVGLAQKKSYHVVVMRCSIPPGTTVKRFSALIEKISDLRAGEDFGLCFNPEFLREGVAIDDFHAPPKTVIGTSDTKVENIMRQIYRTVDASPIITSIETAEMIKYVDNVWHATKVCFANETGRLCKALGVDSHKVMDAFIQDTKLNLSSYYLKPGFAYGGSCLPKEVRAVARIAAREGVSLPLIENLERSNAVHIKQAVRMVLETGARRVGILGLAFKQGTDDLRESPILEVIAALREQGIEVLIHDPAIKPDASLDKQLAYMRDSAPSMRLLADTLPDMMVADLLEVIDNAQALVVSHKNPAYLEAVQNSSAKVIDLVRISKECPSETRYQGIGW